MDNNDNMKVNWVLVSQAPGEKHQDTPDKDKLRDEEFIKQMSALIPTAKYSSII